MNLRRMYLQLCLMRNGIPHTLINHHSMAYNGLFQMTMGWGHFEIPESYLEKADELLRAMRASQPE